MQPEFGLSLFDARGRRKYLTFDERVRFMKASDKLPPSPRLLCMVLAMTGCRISEALALTPEQLDAGQRCIVFRTLKRRKTVFRAVPIESRLMKELVALTWTMPRTAPIWSLSRSGAWRVVSGLMKACGINGPQASPKGLRHGFGVACAEKNISPGLIQKWLGHARLETTMIYLEVCGQEERQFAKRLWHSYARP